jgi:hypothetical protein
VLTAPFFEVVFLAGQLPQAGLDPEGQCQIYFDVQGRAHSVTARIDQIIDSTRLRLQAIEFVEFTHKRRYFRVEAEISLTYRRLQDGPKGQVRRVSGQVTLSGGGLLFPVQEELLAGEKLAMELFVGTAPGDRACTFAEVVRRLPSPRRGQPGLVVQFVKIEPADQDRIIAFCLAEQRRMLQTRVRILEQG